VGWITLNSAVIAGCRVRIAGLRHALSYGLAGLMVMGGFLLLGRLFAGQFPGSARVATIVFVAVWFVVAAVNMWLGVTRAGYSIAEELPIFLLIFVVPVMMAGIIKLQLL
jgi:hypothetical protein